MLSGSRALLRVLIILTFEDSFTFLLCALSSGSHRAIVVLGSARALLLLIELCQVASHLLCGSQLLVRSGFIRLDTRLVIRLIIIAIAVRQALFVVRLPTACVAHFHDANAAATRSARPRGLSFAKRKHDDQSVENEARELEPKGPQRNEAILALIRTDLAPPLPPYQHVDHQP